MSEKVEVKWVTGEDAEKIMTGCDFFCKECDNRCEEDKSIFGFDEKK